MQPLIPRWRLMRMMAVGALVLVPCLGTGTCTTTGSNCPSTQITIATSLSGCGERINTNKIISWVITFTAEGLDPSVPASWTFSDGVTATGTVVTHRFNSAAQEATNFKTTSATGEHIPVKFDVTLTTACGNVSTQVDVPLTGTELDGRPDPDGDTCIPDEGRLHVPVGTALCYSSNPPASGPHYSQAGVAPVAPGFYDEALQTEIWLHNLEHGSVVLLYDCGGTCTDDFKNQLKDLFSQVPVSPRFNEQKLVITRYAGTWPGCPANATFPASSPFLAIAWDVQRSFSFLDVQGILDFYSRHVDQAPEDLNIPSQ